MQPLKLILLILTAWMFLVINGTHSATADDGADQGVQLSAKVRQWVSMLASPSYEGRRQATARLTQAGEAAVAPLVESADGGDLEATHRSVRVLVKIAETGKAGESLAALAALEELEQSGNPSAARRAAGGLSSLRQRSKAAIKAMGAGVTPTTDTDGRPVTNVNLSRYKSSQAVLIHLRYVRNLHALDLSHGEFNGDDMEFLKDFPELRRLNLRGTRVCDAGLEHLQELTSLAVLNLNETEITDAGLSFLGRLEELRDLGLNDCRISDAGLAYLERLTHLESLWLSGTRISSEGLEKLRHALPATTIYW